MLSRLCLRPSRRLVHQSVVQAGCKQYSLLARTTVKLREASCHHARYQHSKGLQLRPYQEECVESVLQAFKEGRRQVGVSLATGAGKTTPKAVQTLILVHRRELVDQAARHCQTRYPDKRVEVEMGKLHASGFADITIASVQSLTSKDRINKFDPSRFKLILVDEAHHIVASTYLNVLDYFGLLDDTVSVDAPALLGVSATMSRFDGLALGKAIKHIVYHKDYIDMIEDSWLCGVVFTTVKSYADLSRVKTSSKSGDFLATSLSKAVNTPEINEVTVKAWITRARERKSTLVFCVDLAHVADLTNTFRRLGIDAKYVTGDTPTLEREERLEAFRRGDFPVLLNCGVFTEGTDIPNIDCVILARPTKSRNLLVQMIGRGMRLCAGKKDCHIMDMVSSLESGIVTTPTLFGLDPDTIVELSNPEQMKKKKRDRAQAEKERSSQQLPVEYSPLSPSRTSAVDTRVTFKDYNSVSDLISDTSGERHIRALSPHCWVAVANDRFILQSSSDDSRSYLAIYRDETPDKPLWRAKYARHLSKRSSEDKKAPFSRPQEIAKSETFEGIVHAADTFASTAFLSTLIRNRAPWRSSPATEGQISYLNRFRAAQKEGLLCQSDVTKGQAKDMITKLIFGARGNLSQIKVARRRQKKNQETAETRRRRETVSVGPVPA